MRLSALSLATALACGTLSSMAMAGDLVPMTIATGVDPSFAPFYVAKAGGIFEEHGLDVTVNTGPSGSAMIAFLIGNQIQAAYGAEQAGVSAHAVDPNVVAVADGTELVDWLSIVAADGISDLEGLVGKRIGVAAGTGSETFWKAVVAHHGLDPAAYEIVNVEAPEMVAALERGNIDAFAAWEPWPTRATSAIAGTSIVETNREVLNLHNLIYMNAEWVGENTEAAVAFVQSMRDAKALIEAEPEKAVDLVAGFLRQPEELVAELLGKVRFIIEMDEATLNAYDVAITQLTAAGKLEVEMAPSDMVYPGLLEAIDPALVRLP